MRALWGISCVLFILPVFMAKKPEKKQQVFPDINFTQPGIVSKNSSFRGTYSMNADVTDSVSATLRLEASVTPLPGKYNLTCPVLFTIQQGEHIESIYFPKNTTYDNSWFVHYKGGKTICFHKSSNGLIENNINIMVSTCAENDTAFTFTLVGYNNSYLPKEVWETNVAISPVSSIFYPFKFSEKSGNDVVLVEVRSEDDTCMIVSVQSPQCPVADQEDTIQFKRVKKNYWQTMSTVALMPVQKEDFPNGFVLVFVVYTDNTRCKQYKGISSFAEEFSVQTSDETRTDPKLKRIRFVINEDLPHSAYIYPVFLPLAFYFAIIGLALFLFVIFYRCTIFCLDREFRRRPSMHVVYARNPIMTVSETMSDRSNSIDSSNSSNATHFSETPGEEDQIRILRSRFNRNHQQQNQTNGRPCVTDLENSVNCQKLGKKSHKYYWIVFTIAIFYSVPVFQLLKTYDQIMERTGDSDLCYYNYHCAHPLWGFIDFNHIYSNIGYVLLGIYFLCLVYYKEKLHERVKEGLQRIAVATSDANHPIPQLNYGTIQHFGIYYALGFSLIMEGVLSAAYHVCPNRSNFQFDTSFMYVIAVLYMLKIYQFRHPVKINANTTFAALAIISVISVLGLLVSQIVVAIIFSLIHLAVVAYIQIYMYYVGYIKDEDGEIVSDRKQMMKLVWQRWKDMYTQERFTTWLRPHDISRIILPLLTVPFNIAVIFLYFFQFDNFATHLLYIFVGNLMLYLTYYILMKVIHLEFISLKSIHPLIYIPLTVVLWIYAMKYFTMVLTSWEKSPAQSRQENEECFLMNFYDYHDMWHFLSAGALFCSFMMLLTLEDMLIETPQSNIPVF